MAQLKTFRCWYKNGSARLVNQSDHKAAALEAMELAAVANADLDRSKPDQRAEYLGSCRVIKTECLADGTERKWKP